MSRPPDRGRASGEITPLDRVSSGLMVVVGALVVITCATTGTLTPLPGTAQGPVLGPQIASAEPAPAEPNAVLGAIEEPERFPPSLPRFHAALRGLLSGTRPKHARIAWFGDSHTAADLMTEPIREQLQRRFGDGGPGFIRLGLTPYRHGRASVTTKGIWERTPKSPARSTRSDDGQFGLGGIRVTAASGGASTTVGITRGDEETPLIWLLPYRLLRADDAFEVSWGEGETVRLARDSNGQSPRVQRLERTAAGPMTVTQRAGRPEFFGVFAEREEPGVVLDTIGIDGARAETLLAWDGPSWQGELTARDPVLVVLAFGTNELFTQHSLETLRGHLVAVLTRVRAAVPEADCLLVGPTDVLQDGTTHPRVLATDEMMRNVAAVSGCGTASLVEAMGGVGGYAAWQRLSPPLAGRDGVHLTKAGYDELGAFLAARLLDGFEFREEEAAWGYE